MEWSCRFVRSSRSGAEEIVTERCRISSLLWLQTTGFPMGSKAEDKPQQRQRQQTEVVLVIPSEDPPTKVFSSASAAMEAKSLRPQPSPGPGPSPHSPQVGESSSAHGKQPHYPSRPEATHILRLSPRISKPKSRFVEQPPPRFPTAAEDSSARPSLSPRVSVGSPASTITPMAGAREDEEDEEDVYKKERLEEDSNKKQRYKRNRCSFWALLEWAILMAATACLATSLSIPKLRCFIVRGLEIWRWCVVAIVVCCGRLLTSWLVALFVFLVERNFLFRKKLLYLVYGLRNSVRLCMWLGLVLLSWFLLFGRGLRRWRGADRALELVTRALVAVLVGSAVWLVKTLMVKLLAASFHVNAFFDRIQESIFHQYILRALSGPPMMEPAERVGIPKSRGQLSFRSTGEGKGKGKEGEEQGVIDVGKLHRLTPEMVTAWTMTGLINAITGSRFLTISDVIDKSTCNEGGGEKKDKEISCEWEAKAAACQIFQNVAKPGSRYIEEEDLLRFLSKEEVDILVPHFEGASETGKIKRKAFKNWMVKAYLDRKSLTHSLDDTKTVVNELHKLISAIAIIIIIMISLLLMGFATIKVLVFISSQLLLLVFIFGNACKIAFEAIIFVFIMHPFDVGDRCVVDGIQMTVEEMNIMTTVFLRYDNEKIYYPNAILATKRISNFYRSPNMSDSVEFCINFSTPMESIRALKARIKSYIESKPQHWHPNHTIVVKDIINVTKMNMALYVLHTMNHQNMAEKSNRRSELIIELKKIFEELSIG